MKKKAVYDVTEGLVIDGKPMWEWADENGWIQIGSWKTDPKYLSLKWINETIEWEIRQAKLDLIEEIKENTGKEQHSHFCQVIEEGVEYQCDCEFRESNAFRLGLEKLREKYKQPEGKLPKI